MFTDERDVRRWVADNAGCPLWWVEHARGGTIGFPDVVAAHDGSAVMMELKLAKWRPDGLVVMVGREQLQVMAEMREANLAVGFVAGIEGSETVALFQPEWLEDAGVLGKRRRMRIGMWESAGTNFVGRLSRMAWK